MKVIKIPYDLEQPCSICDIEDPNDLSDEECWKVLKQIKQLLNIDMVEIVYLNTVCSSEPNRDFCLIVDEVGKLKDGWTDRINARASQFYPGSVFGDPIVGDVAFCARIWSDGFGECDLACLLDSEIVVLMKHLT